MKKNKDNLGKIIVSCFVMLLMILIPMNCEAASYGKTYSLLISGAGEITNNDVGRMKSIITSNKFFLYNNAKTFEYLHYVNTKGISKSTLNSSINKAFSKSTNSDLAIVYYSGHGTTNTQHSKGLGLTLAPNTYYPYNELAKKLSTVKARRIIVVLDACFAGSFYDDGIAKLSNEQQERFILFLSSANNEESQFADSYSRYTGALTEGLGWNGTVYADMNKDGTVTAQELGDYVNIRMKDQLLDNWVDVNPKCYSKNKNFAVYVYTNSKIALNSKKATVNRGEKYQLIATLYNMDGNIKWTSSNSLIATVNSKGKVTTKKAGKVTITANANGKKAKCNITVINPSIKLNKSKLSITLGSSVKTQLKVSVNGASKTVKWKSSNIKIATVSKNGIINPKTNGKVTISATSNGVTAKCVVIIKPSIKLNKTSATIYISGNKTAQLKASVYGKNKTVTWKSTNNKIASVDKKGKVTARKVGAVTITAKANGVSAKCKIIVKAKSGSLNPNIEGSKFWINHIFHYAEGQYEELMRIKKNGNSIDYIVEIVNNKGNYISLWITKPKVTSDSFSGTVYAYATAASFRYYPIKNSDVKIKKISSTEIEATINVPGKVEGVERLQVYE